MLISVDDNQKILTDTGTTTDSSRLDKQLVLGPGNNYNCLETMGLWERAVCHSYIPDEN